MSGILCRKEIVITVHICTRAFVADVKLTTLFTEFRTRIPNLQPPYNDNIK